MLKPIEVALPVRQLVEYVHASGHIEPLSPGATELLQEGTRAHQRVQQGYGDGDQKEVYLSADIPCEELLFRLDGRCDGLLAVGKQVTIDEIKSTGGPLETIPEEGIPVHWAQGVCYAYMYALGHGLQSIGIQLTYVQRVTGDIRRLQREHAFHELELAVQEMLRRYAPYARLLGAHATKRDASIAELPFPYSRYREGQRRLAGAVYRSVEEGVSLFAQAPTGIGKTISTLYPAVKAVGTGHLRRVYYMTARTTTRASAEEALRLMAEKGLHIHAVTITAKEKICPQEEMICRKEHCPYADGYYDRINGAMLDMLDRETLITREVIETYAHKHKVCPFEMSLDAAYTAEVVIGDYNYIFDPRVSFKRLNGETKKRTAILVDEAHNLPDRARAMFSAELHKAPFLALQRELKDRHREGYQAAKAVNDYFIALRKLQAGEARRVEAEPPDRLLKLLETFQSAVEPLLADEVSGMLELYFEVQSFLRTAQLYDERYVTYTETTGSAVTIKLYCLDPSHLLRQTAKGYRSIVYFSATLTPVSYYRDTIGADELDYALTLGSPFKREQLAVRIAPISTRYRDRGASYGPIAELIMEQVRSQPGNYFVFFPSYAYMNALYDCFTAELSGSSQRNGRRIEAQLQRSDMSEEERQSYLSTFQPDEERSLIGFAVMGGVFSEGVDLPGERLVGVIIIGVGLPQLGLERDLLMDYYERKGYNGYQYAYVIPGMNKVLQAGGRLIRSETDRGSLTLVDDRYLRREYERLLPGEWRQSDNHV
ncbi:ATP-dependent DNA helicase [Paenibacillus sp. J5C_2022]|nr:ATP-dependent DNA helicase [Paenibacillus sp. J5C2022]MCU6710758.1 ATP-dependent DNA helicase [Paenibacillus sp. J5C2022]